MIRASAAAAVSATGLPARPAGEVARPHQDGDPRPGCGPAIRAHLAALHDLRDYGAVVLAPARWSPRHT